MVFFVLFLYKNNDHSPVIVKCLDKKKIIDQYENIIMLIYVVKKTFICNFHRDNVFNHECLNTLEIYTNVVGK